MRGTALPVALCFAALIFFLVTVEAAQVNFNLHLVQGVGERTRLQFLSKAICNEVLARMNADPAWTRPTPAEPYEQSAEGARLLGWVVPDPARADVLHVRGRAESLGQPGLAQEFTRVVVQEPEVKGLVYTSGGSNLGEPTSVFRAQAGSRNWELLPPVPNTFYDSQGQPHTEPGDFGLLVGWVAADQEGHAYSIYYPRHENPLANQMLSFGFKDYIHTGPRSTEYLDKYGDIVDRLAGQFAPRENLAAILRYSPDTETWDPLPPIPDVTFDSQRNPTLRPGDYQIEGVVASIAGGPDTVYASLLHEEQDVIYRYDPAGQSWGTLPTPPGARALQGVTADARGAVYSQWAPTRGGSDSKIYSFHADTAAWEELPAVPTRLGEVTIPGDARLGQLAAAPGGELYATLWGSDSLPDTLIRYSEGAWSLADPAPSRYYDSSGNLADAARRKIDFVGVDGDGSAMVKHPHARPGTPDTVFRQASGGFEPLDPLPNQRYTADGELLTDPGFLEFQGPLAGGGGPTGRQRYVTRCSF